MSGGLRRIRPWQIQLDDGKAMARDFRAQTELSHIHQLHAVQGRRCFYCRKWIAFLKLSDDPHCATIDHFIPLALGGRDNLSNAVLACGVCNRRKADRIPTIPEFLQWNELAKSWPHIQPFSLARHAPRMCILCNAPIAPKRLLQSVASRSETETCSPLCRMAMKRNRRLQRQSSDPNRDGGGTKF